MNFEILATGSTGNCTILEGIIAIDMGIPFKTIAEHADGLKLVLLTHIHGDHFNKSTIRRLATEHPKLRFACGEWLVNDLLAAGVKARQIDILDTSVQGKALSYGVCTIRAEETKHNVRNCSWKIQMGGEKLFYATDCNNLDGIFAPAYDYYLVEANYDEDEIQQRMDEKKANGEYAYEWQVVHNHLSRAKAEKWLANNAADNSQFVFMHQHQDKEKAV